MKMEFQNEIKLLMEHGCRKITIELCELVRSYQHTDFSLDNLIVYHYTPCDFMCEYYIPVEDAIPYLIYIIMEYGIMLHCESLYTFHILTNKLNRYPIETEYNEYKYK